MNAARTGETENQYLAFELDGESYGVSIGAVREEPNHARITEVPTTPRYVRGVMNLRGSIVPVLDIKSKFGVGLTGRTDDTCVVIVPADAGGEEITAGFLTDRLLEVFENDMQAIEPPPKTGTRIDSDVIQGMGRRDDGFTVLFDMGRVFFSEDREGFFTGHNA